MKEAGFFDLTALGKTQEQSARRYFEFLRVPAMSAGLYFLPAGGTDPQSPHLQDELYYVVRGKSRFRAAEQDRAVGQGSVIFVAAGVEHRFYDIAEDLQVLVFFAPAESD